VFFNSKQVNKRRRENMNKQTSLFVVVFMIVVCTFPCFAENSGYRWTPFQFGIWPEAPNIQLFPCEWDVYGLGAGLATFNSHVYGLQVCGGCIAADSMQGIQLGIFSATGAMRGIQVGGFMNYTENITGVQMGAFQYSQTMKGLQLGLLNICTDTMVGVQIGIINYAKNAVGVQIGLGNVIEHSPVQRLPIINIHF
jgi:hypothetical protein